MTEANQRLSSIAYWILAAGISYYFALLPFQPTFLPASLGMMVAGVGWLVSLIVNRRQLILNKQAAVVYLCLALYYLSGLSISDHPEYHRIINTQIPLLFWGLPFVVYEERFLQFATKQLPAIFLISAVLSAVVFVGNFFLLQITDPTLEYSKRSPYYFLPVHYLGLYYNVAVVLLHTNFFRIDRIYKITALVVLSGAVILLASRIQWVILLVVLFLHFFFSRKISAGKVVVFSLTLVISFIALYNLVPEVKRRTIETFDEINSLSEVKNGKQTNHRKFIWKEALILLKEVPFTGFRPGKADTLLMDRLSACDEKFWDGEKVYYLREGSYNYHNQFLQAIAERGAGALFLFFSLLLPLVIGRNRLSAMMVFVFVFSMLTESILQRQAGVFLVASFLPMITSIARDQRHSTKNSLE